MLPKVDFIFPPHKETGSAPRVIALEQKAWERGESFPPDMADQLGLARSGRVFSAKANEVLFLPPRVAGEAGLILAGLGKAPDAAQWRQAGARIGAQIAAPGLPTLFVQEGGYLCEELGQNLTAALTGFEEACA